jgi:hypothetical protein
MIRRLFKLLVFIGALAYRTKVKHRTQSVPLCLCVQIIFTQRHGLLVTVGLVTLFVFYAEEKDQEIDYK